MREGHRPLIRRIAAAAALSVALHLSVGYLGGSMPLGSLLGGQWRNADSLVVEVVTGEDRRPGPTPTRVASPRRALPPPPAPPVSLPAALPLPEPALDGPPAPDFAQDAGVVAALVASANPTVAAPDAVAPTAPAGAIPAGGEGDAAEPSPSRGAIASAAAEPAADPAGAVGSPDGPQQNGAEAPRGTAAAAVSPPDAAQGDAGAASREVEAAEGSPPRGAGERPGGGSIDRARLDAVARNPSVSARAAGAPFVGRREVFEFLLDHPEFATHVTRALRVARYRIWRTDDGLFVDDGWGATGQMYVVRAATGTRVLYARGEYQHKLFPAITGEAVVTITYDARPVGDGRELLLTDVSSQLRIDGAFGEMVVKLASNLATEKAEKESRRLVHIFARVLKAVDEKPAALYASLLERPDVPRRELEQFRVLLGLP